ncbi:hypothetical protein [Winogradskyella vidalii]|uniref:hypothetical protein n=1 Tax=Winogradskyella vidalii TaxID=2615024 RepID=UPI0015C9B77C|nr:hypothetical protein [Winogradskyella vidalii]
MKNFIIKSLFVLFAVNMSSGQPWMTDLETAQSLASVQNKMVLMVWEESTNYPYHVFVNDDKGNTILIQNMFEDESISPLIWQHFVPVIVSEFKYEDLFKAIKGKRSQEYIDKFNDDSIKILDTNGNILNVLYYTENYQNISTLIQNYALNTAFISNELNGYDKKKDFYSAFYLSSKYLDFSMYMKEEVREEIIDLSTIYLKEATALIVTSPTEEQLALKQRVALLEIQKYLILERPRKVLRQLKRMEAENIAANNQAFFAFLYYTSYKILNDNTKAEAWKSKLSSVDLKKAQQLININS